MVVAAPGATKVYNHVLFLGGEIGRGIKIPRQANVVVSRSCWYQFHADMKYIEAHLRIKPTYNVTDCHQKDLNTRSATKLLKTKRKDIKIGVSRC